MFDWLGLSAESTQLVGWIFIGVAIILMVFLVWFAVQIVKDMKKTQKKLEVMDASLDDSKLDEEKIKKDELVKNKALIKNEKKNKKYEEKSRRIAEKAKAKQEKLESKKNMSSEKSFSANVQTRTDENLTTNQTKKDININEIEPNVIKEQSIKEEQNYIETQTKITPNTVEEKVIEENEPNQIDKSTAEIIEEIQEQMENNAYINALKDIDENKKNYYCKIKNLFCTFPELDNELIKDAETFDYNKKVIGLITVRNGNLILYLKLSKADLDKRFAHDETEYNKYKRIPIQFLLNDETIMREAMNCIEKLVSELDLFRSETYKSRKFNYLIKF